MIEVEVKAKIDDREILIKKIKELGAVKVKTQKQSDLYFNAPHRDFAETDEAIRIRKSNSDTYITYKGPKIDDKSKTRKELEVGVDDPETAAEILQCLGFVKVREVRKLRDIYSLDNFTVSVDSVKGLGSYLEIEAEVQEGQSYQGIVDEIYDLYSQLGVSNGFERRSYLELLEINE